MSDEFGRSTEMTDTEARKMFNKAREESDAIPYKKNHGVYSTRLTVSEVEKLERLGLVTKVGNRSYELSHLGRVLVSRCQ